MKVGEEGGEGEKVEDNDIFSNGIFCFFFCFSVLYDHLCPLITSYFILDYCY